MLLVAVVGYGCCWYKFCFFLVVVMVVVVGDGCCCCIFCFVVVAVVAVIKLLLIFL